MNRSDPSSEPWGTSLHFLYKHVLHITTRTERWWFEWPQSWCDDCSQEMNWTNNLSAKILIIITCSLHWQIWFIKREELLWIRSFSSGSPLDQLDEAPTSSLTSLWNHSAGRRSRCWLTLAEHFSPSPQRHAVQYAETSPSPLHPKSTWIADYLEGNIPACSTAERQQHDWNVLTLQKVHRVKTVPPAAAASLNRFLLWSNTPGVWDEIYSLQPKLHVCHKRVKNQEINVTRPLTEIHLFHHNTTLLTTYKIETLVINGSPATCN